MVTVEDIRQVAMSLPRTEEHLIRDRIKFRVGRIVYVAICADERSMGFGFPREERAALVASEPDRFFMPIPSDERYNWVRVWLHAIDAAEMRELVVDAWRMVVPKRVAASHDAGATPARRPRPTRPRPSGQPGESGPSGRSGRSGRSGG